MSIDLAVITDENVDDMIDAAQYGITYWATELPQAAIDAAKADAVCHFGDDEGNTYHLSRTDIREAYAKLLDAGQPFVNEQIHGYFVGSWKDRDTDGIDAGWIDSDAGDVLLQVAAFGEVVYG